MFFALQIFFAARAVLKIGEYINNSLHLARKYATEDICPRTFSVPRREQFFRSGG